VTHKNIAGPDEKQAASPCAAISEAEEHEKAKAELSDLRDQLDQTKAEADQAHEMIHRAHVWVEASLASLDDPDRADKPERDDSPVMAALITLQMAAERFRDPRVDVVRMERKIVELAKIFDAADQIVRNA
jgi:hypothetical protein